MAGVDDCNRSRDSTEMDFPPEKKPKIETDTEVKEEEVVIQAPLDYFYYRGKLFRKGDRNDPECARQRDLFYKQFEETEGFDVDWDSFDYPFNVINFFWDPYLDDKRSNEELIILLIQAAIQEYDELYETKLEFVKHVSTNITPCRGLMYHITFVANDLKSTNEESKSYQAKVCKFAEEISVVMVRLKQTN